MPWDKVDIEVLLVELEFAGKVYQLILISYDKLFNRLKCVSCLEIPLLVNHTF